MPPPQKLSRRKGMCSLGYLTYDEFINLGGKCPEDAFPRLQYDVELKMDYVTFGRLSKMIERNVEVPKEVQYLEVKLIDIYYDSEKRSEKKRGLTSYSNGIESFGYESNSSTEDEKIMDVRSIIKQYLLTKYPELFYRGRVIPNARNNNFAE